MICPKNYGPVSDPDALKARLEKMLGSNYRPRRLFGAGRLVCHFRIPRTRAFFLLMAAQLHPRHFFTSDEGDDRQITSLPDRPICR